MDIEKKQFTKKLWVLAFPIMLQNLLGSSLSFLDTLMVGQLGTSEIAAVGVANQIFFLVNLFAFGLASGAGVFFSQYFGSHSYDKMKKVMGLCLKVTVAGSAIWALASLMVPEQIMHIFTYDPYVVELGAEYQRIVALSYVAFAVQVLYSIGFRSINSANIPLLASFVSMTTNAIGNYILIFGMGPIPAMGVAGAAWATLISRFIELGILILVSIRRKVPFLIDSTSCLHHSREYIRDYFRISLPVLLNEMLWALGMTMYKVAYSKMGIETLAVINITESIVNFFFVAQMGVGNGATVMIGNTIGEGRMETTRRYARWLLISSFVIGAVMGAFQFLSSDFFPSLFKVDESVRIAAARSLRTIAMFQFIKACNMTMLVGIMRGAGDTRFALISEIAAVWFIGVPFAFISAALFHLPIWIVYIFVNFEEIAKFIIGLVRIKSGRWINILT